MRCSFYLKNHFKNILISAISIYSYQLDEMCNATQTKCIIPLTWCKHNIIWPWLFSVWLKLCLLAIFNNFGGQSTRWKWRWPARLFYRGKEISVKNNILNDDIFSKGQKKYYMVIMLVTMRVMASKSYINEPTVYTEI